MIEIDRARVDLIAFQHPVPTLRDVSRIVDGSRKVDASELLERGHQRPALGSRGGVACQQVDPTVGINKVGQSFPERPHLRSLQGFQVDDMPCDQFETAVWVPVGRQRYAGGAFAPDGVADLPEQTVKRCVLPVEDRASHVTRYRCGQHLGLLDR